MSKEIGIKELTELKEQIETAKASIANLEGQEQAIMRQLKDTYKCNTTAIAKAKVKEIEEDIEKLQSQIDKGTKELEEKYEL